MQVLDPSGRDLAVPPAAALLPPRGASLATHLALEVGAALPSPAVHPLARNPASRDVSVGVAFGMVVAPGEGQIALDTLDSLATFFPGASRWILDDCTSDGTYEALRRWV